MKKLLLLVAAATLTLSAPATGLKTGLRPKTIHESVQQLKAEKLLDGKLATTLKSAKGEAISSGALRAKSAVTPVGTAVPYMYSDYYFDVVSVKVSTSKDGSKVFFSNMFPYVFADEEAWVQGNVSTDGTRVTIPLEPIAELESTDGLYNVYPVEMIVSEEGNVTGVEPLVFVKVEDRYYFEDDYTNPARFIGLCALEDDGTFIGYFDYTYIISYDPYTGPTEVVELPEGAVPNEYTYLYYATGLLRIENGLVYIDGNDVYMNLLTCGYDAWVKGARDGNTVTFPGGQYVGLGSYLTFQPFYTDGTTDEEGYLYTYPCDYVFDFDPETYTFTTKTEEGKDFYTGLMTPNGGLYSYAFDYIVGMPIEGPAVPSDPFDLSIDDYTEYYGQYHLNYTIYPFDVNGNFINLEHLSYIIYMDEEPYTLTPELFIELEEEMTIIPYGFSDDWDIYTGSCFIAEDLFNTLGIQAVYIVDGVINFSNVVSVDLDGNVTKSSIHPRINTSLSIVSPTNTINIGESITLSSSYTTSYGGRRAKSAAHAPTITPVNASNQNLNWWSSNNNYATVTNGVVTGKGEGMVNIFAETTNGNEKDASCMIRVKEPDDPSSDGHIYALRGYFNSNYYQCIQQEVKGLTADGKSQVFIPWPNGKQSVGSPIITITDPNGNVISSSVGQNENGTISSLLTKFEEQGFVYTAPIDFIPDYNGKYYLANFKIPIGNGNDGLIYDFLPSVRIYRPGLLLVHGLWGNATSFEDFGKYLDNNADYKPYYQLVDYKENNSDSFYDNTHDNKILNEACNDLYRRLMDMGILSARYDFVGHSMGGILSRLYIQEDNNDAAHKIITVNTPHWGSGFADRGDELRNVISLLSGISPLSVAVEYAYLDNPAIYDLKSSSPAIKNLGKGAHVIGDKSIPVHAVCSIVADAYEENEEALKYLKENDFNAFITASYYMTIADMAPDGQSILNWIFNGDKHDGIVELTSQQGGLSGDHCTIEVQRYKGFIGLGSDSHHMNTTKWAKTHESLEKLLKAKTSDPLFDRNGFKDINASQGSGSWAKKKNYELPVLKAPASEKTYISIGSTLKVENDSVKVDITLTHSEDIVKNMVFGFLNEDKVITGIGRDDYTLQFPNTYSGSFMLYALGRSANDEIVSDSVLLEIPAMAKVKYITFIGEPSNMSVGQLSKFSVKAIWSNGEETYIEPEFTTSDNSVLRVNGNYIEAVAEGSSMLTAIYEDHTTSVMLEVTDYGEIDGLAEIRSEGEYKIYNDGETLYVEAPDARIRNIELRLFDASGTLIQNLHATTNGNKKAFSLDLGNRKGLFVVQCISDDFKGSYRFVY